MKQKDYFYDRALAKENDPDYDPWDDPNYDPWAEPDDDAWRDAWGTPERIPPPTDADYTPERIPPPTDADYPRAVAPLPINADYTPEVIPPPTDADCPPEAPPPPPIDADYPRAVAPLPIDADYTPEAPPPPTDADYPPEAPPPNSIADIAQYCIAHMPSSCIAFNPKAKVPMVDEWAFVKWLSEFAEVRCINYRFYLFGIKVDAGVLKRTMLEIVCEHAEVTAPKLSSMLNLLESFTICPSPAVDVESISFANKTLTLHHAQPHALSPTGGANGAAAAGGAAVGTESITLRMQQPSDFSFCRVPHNFNPNAGEPTRLLAFLNGLFAPEDLPTVQEYLGYCLMPSTKAQKALFIIGKGGEGKSRLSVLMKLVLGDAAVVSSVAKISDRFFPCMLENRLLFIDDDLQTTKFAATDAFKSLVTSETPIMVEQKGTPHYEMQPYARFLLMGNQSVGSLHDKSHGFYRRVHIIHTLPVPQDRANNPTLIQDIWAAEKDAILLWLVKGALRLARQNYRLTESEASRAALAALKEDDNTALSFLKEQNFIYGEWYSVTSNVLTAKYKEWCLENDLFKVGGHAFKQTCEAYFAKGGASYDKNVPSALGRVRGYTGVGYSYP